ncbi:MAG: hypothetical protein NTX31_11500 [Burkholderiales bacterium]|nr:hypothetical protein [Burkholderiales bacterium]
MLPIGAELKLIADPVLLKQTSALQAIKLPVHGAGYRTRPACNFAYMQAPLRLQQQQSQCLAPILQREQQV